MIVQNIQGIFRSKRAYRALALFLSGILVGILPDIAVAGGVVVIAGMAALALIAWIVSIFLPRQHRFNVIIKSPQTITSPQEETNYARQVFIGFVPLFTPQSAAVKQLAREAKEEYNDAIKNLDFDRLELEKSNFQPTIKAIVSHKSKLKHCYLLATTGTSPTSVGSLAHAELLTEYLKQRHGLTCEFHFGQEYSISLDEDSLVLGKTYDLIQRVFQEIPREFDFTQVVADITTGFRSMTLGMILACLDEERDIEFVGTKYDENGKPDGSLKPTIFSFHPQMRQEG
jgi:hypothetical protein